MNTNAKSLKHIFAQAGTAYFCVLLNGHKGSLYLDQNLFLCRERGGYRPLLNGEPCAPSRHNTRVACGCLELFQMSVRCVHRFFTLFPKVD